MERKKIFVILFLPIFIGACVYFSYRYYKEAERQKIAQKILLEKRKAGWIELKQVLENEVSRFKGEAGIVVKDLDMNWEISFNKDKLFPSASLVKIPIMAACFQANHEGKIDLKDTLKLKPSYKTPGSGVLKKMPDGSVFTVEKIIELMVTKSDNTAANMLINLLGFGYLNNYFEEFGLKNTNLSRKIMDFKRRKEGIENYTTSEDMTLIFEEIYRKKLLNSTISERCLSLLRQQRISDRIPAKLPTDTIVAHKTGLERKVCHDAGIVYTHKGDFLICVLIKHKDRNSKAAKKFISEVALNAYNYYQQF